jgi:hypothetical protein
LIATLSGSGCRRAKVSGGIEQIRNSGMDQKYKGPSSSKTRIQSFQDPVKTRENVGFVAEISLK